MAGLPSRSQRHRGFAPATGFRRQLGRAGTGKVTPPDGGVRGEGMTKQETRGWDHSNRGAFISYYARESQTERTRQRFAVLQRTALRILGDPAGPLDVADLGCGAGTQSILWARAGHRVHGLDVSA